MVEEVRTRAAEVVEYLDREDEEPDDVSRRSTVSLIAAARPVEGYNSLKRKSPVAEKWPGQLFSTLWAIYVGGPSCWLSKLVPPNPS